jgi:cation diffusion facilitator CzcD-associated flavoprotein CzcO
MPENAIVIVGGGAAGLSTAGALASVGLRSTVLERDASIGGSWRRRYHRLHLHTVRRFSGLAHFPIPSQYPRYLSRTMYAEYLEAYAKHFAIDVQYGCPVERVTQTDSMLRVETPDRVWDTRTVVIAGGMYNEPVIPSLDGLERYQGTAIHSSAYTSGRDFAGKRVVVIGIGNTGAELCADLVESGAAQVAVSIRTMPPIVPRDFLGTPVQLFGIALSRFPKRLADRIGAAVARVALGDLAKYGMRGAEWLPFSARRIPVIDVGFVENIKAGRISIRPPVTQLFESGVRYADGSEEPFDAVIFATGYATGLKRTIDIPGLLDDRGYPLFASGARTSTPGLYFMGYFESHRGLLFEIAHTSQRLAHSILADSRTHNVAAEP